jgi:sugar O-acyltransferase (sialic acid O-acetyltransferase NeuD family)
MSGRDGDEHQLMQGIAPEVLLWGGTGQAKVIRPIIEHYGSRVVAVFDDTPNLPPTFPDVPLFHGWTAFQQWVAQRDRSRLGFCVAIGNPHGRVRLALSEKLKAEGLRCISVVHPHACIEPNARIGEGCQIHAGAIVGAEAVLGRQCIVNTKASVDHECVLEDGVEIAPGATLCGLVRVRVNGWVCAGATILPRLTIHADAVVGAGAVVTRDVPAGTTVIGVPAALKSRRQDV